MNTASHIPRIYTETELLRLLTDYSSDEAWVNRQLGAQLVAAQQVRSVERQLLHLLTDPVDWVRFHSLQALIALHIAPTRVVPFADRLLNDPFFRVRQLAASFFQQCLLEAVDQATNTSVSK